ncbi:MAG: hypothetical protein Q9216_003253 [Gyalolechia sp. 2 TL-2023]
MVQIYDPISTKSILLLAVTLISVSAQAVIGASSNASSVSSPVSTTCSTTSLNPILQTLPQQCLATAWPGSVEDQAVAGASPESLQIEPRPTESVGHLIKSILPRVKEDSVSQTASDHKSSKVSTSAIASTYDAESKPKEEAVLEAASDGDNDSPLDNAHFLSFEEWKKQNLAKAGQSADSLGAGKSGVSEPRRRPGGINNALDSLGEDTEIEIDFGGFVASQVITPGNDHSQQPSPKGKDGQVDRDEPSIQPSKPHARSKDAGVTCKERSNYASFDCAATVLKANPESKSATSVLVENKDSYMLNRCSAANSFFIVELCDDILVDTVVLANFEFFSSIFRTFRVSVSDRYPVKLDKWRELGTFEAKNNRGIQAFLVEEPQIWARYLRIEFLTHYGHEYYCPVSLLRVHGTTMMEEFNHEMKSSKGEDESDDEEQPEEAPSVLDAVTAEVLRTEFKTDTEPSAMTAPPAADSSPSSSNELNHSSKQFQSNSASMLIESSSTSSNTTHWDNNLSAQLAVIFASRDHRVQVCSCSEAPTYLSTPVSVPTVSTTSKNSLPSVTGASSVQTTSLSAHSKSIDGQTPVATSPSSSTPDTIQSAVNENSSASSKVYSTSSNAAPKSYASPTHPSPPNPTTQESFFKSVHKRLQLLESNSTLSLQYIEEQSRILRDAFAKVEKRQLAKTSNFLEILNTTVLNEVREFRAQYDQIWQSTVLELSSQRHQSQTEITALNTRLALLADEVLLQKRIAILQFLLILLCLGLALISRGAAGVEYIEHVVNKSSFNLSRYASNLDSPPLGSPSSTRPSSRYGLFSRAASSLHRRSPSEESMGVEGVERGGAKSPGIEYEPPTPTSLSEGSGGGGSPEREVNGMKEPEGLHGMLSPSGRTVSSSSGSTQALKRSWHANS